MRFCRRHTYKSYSHLPASEEKFAYGRYGFYLDIITNLQTMMYIYSGGKIKCFKNNLYIMSSVIFLYCVPTGYFSVCFYSLKCNM